MTLLTSFDMLIIYKIFKTRELIWRKNKMINKTAFKEYVEVFNDDKIDELSATIITTRVKVFLVNSNDEILIATSGGGCQLPGGHIEEGEGILQGTVREVEEETGIILDYNEILGQFYKIKYLQKNYQNTGKNRLSQVIYFLAKTDKHANIANLNLTENEKINNFDIKYIKFTNFENFVKQFIIPNQKEINLVIAKEMLKVYQYLVKISS